MASLNSLYIKKDLLRKILNTLDKKTGKDSEGLEITISLSDTANQYGQNVSAWISQTKEQREAKADRIFVGNGKTFWSDTQQAKPEKSEPKPREEKGINSDDDDLPF